MDGLGDSSASLATVRQVFEHFAEGDLDAMFELVHDDAEFHPVFYPGTYRGRDAIRAVFEDGGSRLNWSLTELRFEAVADRVLVHGRFHSTNTFGSAGELPIALLLGVADGRIVEMRGFVHPRLARESLA